jgi:hypothetical protein
MNILIHSLDHYWEKRNDYFAGGNIFVYFSREQVKNRVGYGAIAYNYGWGHGQV